MDGNSYARLASRTYQLGRVLLKGYAIEAIYVYAASLMTQLIALLDRAVILPGMVRLLHWADLYAPMIRTS